MKHIKRIPIFVRTAIISDKQFSCPYTKPYGYIYKITNQINGHYYIGKHRFEHPWLDKNYQGSGKLLWKAYEKYGIENFETIILEWTDKDNDELNRLEKLYINVFHANERPNYNLLDGGDGVSPENVRGEKNGMYNDHRFAGENNPMYGVHRNHTEQEKKHQSESLTKSHKDNPQWAKNHSKCMTNKHKDPEYKKHITDTLVMFYKEHPEAVEHQRDIGKAIAKDAWSGDRGNKRRELYSQRWSGSNNPSAKPVVMLNLDWIPIKIYEYLAEVRKDGFCDSIVSICCRGKRNPNQYKGYRWLYLEDCLKQKEISLNLRDKV